MLPSTFVLEVTGQTSSAFTPPPGFTCAPGLSPAMSNGQWSCAEPLVESDPIAAVLLVAGFCALFLGVLVLHFIFPA
jgi:hypothetical protein